MGLGEGSPACKPIKYSIRTNGIRLKTLSIGPAPWNRTHGLSRRSQALYRLRYRGFISQSLMGGHIKQAYLPVNVLQTKDFSVLDNFCVSSPYPPKHSTKMYTLLAPQWKREVTQAPVDTQKNKKTLQR